MSENLEINGEVPNLVDQILEDLLCAEMWFEGTLEEPANVIYLKVNGNWFRHYFDYGIVFWRSQDKAPESYEMQELDSYFKLVDLANNFGFKGLKIKRFDAYTIEGGSESVFTFDNSSSIVFSNINDVTVYRT
ncbi:hypothetical protein [Vibrio neptunius]|uniref:Uncharacterized protein n=1 Tax=Vibrio neptunius TaxID=170651 RepID=A0ABS3A6L4_9VIBR|nr:hypothetical protein [Vibrio neptunius]MBN3494071.1 hypothetical protein [Vibrio neptunius]MBN3516568.1 hypothetical protein [Vibrio neptunius]MBN3550742.1 hypothetical protein [Vibrio neptunius]MBN3578873.1 hypothetical protein [Vibrio neptunius]MCH9872538.1 hypothetical protein [Vibrio neptunius]